MFRRFLTLVLIHVSRLFRWCFCSLIIVLFRWPFFSLVQQNVSSSFSLAHNQFCSIQMFRISKTPLLLQAGGFMFLVCVWSLFFSEVIEKHIHTPAHGQICSILMFRARKTPLLLQRFSCARPISLTHDLSMFENRLASFGNCFAMSPPTKTASR